MDFHMTCGHASRKCHERVMISLASLYLSSSPCCSSATASLYFWNEFSSSAITRGRIMMCKFRILSIKNQPKRQGTPACKAVLRASLMEFKRFLSFFIWHIEHSLYSLLRREPIRLKWSNQWLLENLQWVPKRVEIGLGVVLSGITEQRRL